jgi:hypothetical protein
MIAGGVVLSTVPSLFVIADLCHFTDNFAANPLCGVCVLQFIDHWHMATGARRIGPILAIGPVTKPFMFVR